MINISSFFVRLHLAVFKLLKDAQVILHLIKIIKRERNTEQFKKKLNFHSLATNTDHLHTPIQENPQHAVQCRAEEALTTPLWG